MKTANFTTVTYDIGGGFYVDIVSKNNLYEAWIYHEDYGQKELMFGCPKEQQSYSEFVEIVYGNIPWHRDAYADSMIVDEAFAIPFN